MTDNPTSRAYNTASVLDVVLSGAPLTPNELIERTGLSKATVSRAVEELRVAGLVVNGGVDSGIGRGRRSTNLDVPGTAGHVVGISYGVQTTCVLVADLRGREVQHVLLPTVNHQEVQNAAEWLVGLAEKGSKSAEGPLRQIVVAVPGRLRSGTEIVSPVNALRTFAGSGLQRAITDLVNAPVLLDSDANASLLGIVAEDATVKNAALFSLSSAMNFASCAGQRPAFGDIGVLFSGVGNETLSGLLSSTGLLRFARGRGLDLERIEDLWLMPQDKVPRADVLDAFTTAIVTAVTAVTVTLDPETIFFVGRLQPLVGEVIPEVRSRLDKTLTTTVPQIKAPAQVLGMSVARGAVYACLGLARDRLRDAVLETRVHGQKTGRSALAF